MRNLTLDLGIRTADAILQFALKNIGKGGLGYEC